MSPRRVAWFALALGAGGCEADPEPGGFAAGAGSNGQLTNDWPFDIPDPPEGGEQIRTPIYTIPPYEERTFCLWGRWSETTGIDFYEWFQDVEFSHHLRMDEVYTGDPRPAGTVTDCSDAMEAAETGLRPLFNATEPGLQEGKGRMVLTDGKGVVVDAGDAWVIQSHYTNYSGEDIRVQDIVNLGFLPVEEVSKPLSTWTFDNVSFAVPPGETQEVSFSCTWGQDAVLDMWMVHMHDYARSFSATLTPADGSAPLLLVEYDPWDPDMRYLPELNSVPGGLQVHAGDRVDGACVFVNRDDTPLTFPHEMCVLEGMAWPMDEAFVCDDVGRGTR